MIDTTGYLLTAQRPLLRQVTTVHIALSRNKVLSTCQTEDLASASI